MADEKISLSQIPLADSAALSNTDSVLGLVGDAARRVSLLDLKTDVSSINTAITNLQSDVGGLTTNMGTAQSDISSLKTHTSSTNSDLSNSNLNSLIDATARKGGYSVQTSTAGGTSNPSLVYTGDPYTNQNLGTWLYGVMTNVVGATPTSSGSGSATTYSWTYNTSSAMSSQFVLDLKKNNFDNNWTANRSYAAGVVVVYDNTLYKCITPNNDASFTPAKWTALSSSGGGGISGTDFEIWKQLRNIVLEGITRELSPEYSWTNPADSIGSYANNTTDQGYWSNAAASTLGYQATADTSGSTLFDKNESYLYYQSNGSYYYAPGDSIYKNTNLQLRTNILKMLSTLMTEYKDFEEKILYKIANDSELNPYNDIPIGTINNGSFDCYVATNKPTYTIGSNNEYTLTSSATYNEKADLIKSLMDVCAPKRITGIFRAANWVTTETRGRVNWCPLTDIDNPEHAHILHSAVYSDTDPAGDDYPDCSNSGLNYYFNDAIMDVYLPGIEYGTSETNNTLRKQILEAYNLIQDTNISYQPTWKASSQKTYQYDRVDDSGYDMIANYNNWSTGGDCGGIVAYIDPDEDVPTVDIPVQILIFPKFHDRTDYIQSNS